MMLDTLFPHGNIMAFLMLCALFAFGTAFGGALAYTRKEDGEVNPWVTSSAVLSGIVASFLIYHAVVGT